MLVIRPFVACSRVQSPRCIVTMHLHQTPQVVMDGDLNVHATGDQASGLKEVFILPNLGLLLVLGT